MRLEKIKRWQWTLIGAAAGALLEFFGPGAGATDPGAHVAWVADQRRFEAMLVQRDAGGQLRFRDIVVHPAKNRVGPDGRATAVYPVTGRFHATDDASGAAGAPVGFEAAVPFRPKTDLARYVRTGGADYAAQYRAIPQPTIRDYLAILKEAAGIESSYAWWRLPGVTPAAWILGTMAIVGGAWPTLINLIVYRSLRRPREEPAVSLAKSPAATVRTTATVTAPDLDALDALERELEANLSAAPNQTSVAPVPVAAAPARVFTAASASEHQTVADDGPSAEFGIDKDDYYPTVRHAAPHPSEVPTAASVHKQRSSNDEPTSGNSNK